MSADNKWKQFLLYQRDFPFENPISIAYFPFFKYNILRNGKNYVYSKELKIEMIEKVLLQKYSINSVSLEYGFRVPDY